MLLNNSTGRIFTMPRDIMTLPELLAVQMSAHREQRMKREGHLADAYHAIGVARACNEDMRYVMAHGFIRTGSALLGEIRSDIMVALADVANSRRALTNQYLALKRRAGNAPGVA
jgi:hypothetical protein